MSLFDFIARLSSLNASLLHISLNKRLEVLVGDGDECILHPRADGFEKLFPWHKRGQGDLDFTVRKGIIVFQWDFIDDVTLCESHATVGVEINVELSIVFGDVNAYDDRINHFIGGKVIGDLFRYPSDPMIDPSDSDRDSFLVMFVDGEVSDRAILGVFAGVVCMQVAADANRCKLNGEVFEFLLDNGIQLVASVYVTFVGQVESYLLILGVVVVPSVISIRFGHREST